ncbi:MAG: SCP2 sterol-binding domain-containing protein [Spirochaetota bacterium]|jgi:putative sterol carrier protein
MNYDFIKSRLHLYAVLQNIEDLVQYDEEAKKLIKDWNVVIKFTVKGSGNVNLIFENGKCIVTDSTEKKPDIVLFFTSPAHLNKMFDGKANPIPLKGLTKLGFLTKEFPKLTERLEYYLKPDDQKLKDSRFVTINTVMTLNTALFALKELLLFDPIGKHIAKKIKGSMLMMNVDKGPAVYIEQKDNGFEVHKGYHEQPLAVLQFKSMKIANDFLNGKMDAFSAIASGAVATKGHIEWLDAVSPVLDRIALYLA